MTRQDVTQNLSKAAWGIDGLAADGPYPGLKEKLDLFGQFVGEWDIVEARYPKPDGTTNTVYMLGFNFTGLSDPRSVASYVSSPSGGHARLGSSSICSTVRGG